MRTHPTVSWFQALCFIRLFDLKTWLKNSFYQAAWAPLTVFVFYVVAAKGFNAYLLYPWLGIPTHFFGGLAIAYFFLIAVANSQTLLGPIPKIVQLSLALGLTSIMAVVWEIFEYFSDIALGTSMNLGVLDTLSDLCFGLLGGAVTIAFAIRSARFRQTNNSILHDEGDINTRST